MCKIGNVHVVVDEKDVLSISKISPACTPKHSSDKRHDEPATST